jgi:hypothetical protein
VPALPPVASVLRLDLLWTLGSDTDASTRLYWLYSGTPPTNATCVSLSSSINGIVSNRFIPLVQTNTTFKGARVTDLTSSTAGTGITSVTTAGSRSGGTLPASTNMLVNYQLGRRYRGGKPRSYWPFGVVTDITTEQTWTAGFLTSTNTGYTNFNSDMNVLTVTGCSLTRQVNISYYSGFTAVLNPVTGRYRNVPKQRTTPLTDTVTSFSANSKFGSQRRRNLHQA